MFKGKTEKNPLDKDTYLPGLYRAIKFDTDFEAFTNIKRQQSKEFDPIQSPRARSLLSSPILSEPI